MVIELISSKNKPRTVYDSEPSYGHVWDLLLDNDSVHKLYDESNGALIVWNCIREHREEIETSLSWTDDFCDALVEHLYDDLETNLEVMNNREEYDDEAYDYWKRKVRPLNLKDRFGQSIKMAYVALERAQETRRREEEQEKEELFVRSLPPFFQRLYYKLSRCSQREFRCDWGQKIFPTTRVILQKSDKSYKIIGSDYLTPQQRRIVQSKQQGNVEPCFQQQRPVNAWKKVQACQTAPRTVRMVLAKIEKVEAPIQYVVSSVEVPMEKPQVAQPAEKVEIPCVKINEEVALLKMSEDDVPVPEDKFPKEWQQVDLKEVAVEQSPSFMRVTMDKIEEEYVVSKMEYPVEIVQSEELPTAQVQYAQDCISLPSESSEEDEVVNMPDVIEYPLVDNSSEYDSDEVFVPEDSLPPQQFQTLTFRKSEWILAEFPSYFKLYRQLPNGHVQLFEEDEEYELPLYVDQVVKVNEHTLLRHGNIVDVERNELKNKDSLSPNEKRRLLNNFFRRCGLNNVKYSVRDLVNCKIENYELYKGMSETYRRQKAAKYDAKFSGATSLNCRFFRKKEIDIKAKIQMDAPSLEQAATISSTANITFVDERPIDTATTHTTGDVQTVDSTRAIAETPWTLNNVLTREVYITTIPWSVTDEPGKMLYINGIPRILTDNTNFVTNQLRVFAYLRSGMRIRVQLNGTKFHQGRLVAYFQPLMFREDAEHYNFNNYICFPHVILDASVSNSGTIDIPYTHLLANMPMRDSAIRQVVSSMNALGCVKIAVFNMLQAAELASTSLNITVYASLLNPQVHQSTHQIDNFGFTDGVPPYLDVHPPVMHAQSLEGVIKNAAGGLIDSGIGLLDNMTGGLVTGIGNAFTGLFGLNGDKPSDPISSRPIINRTADALCHGAGLDRSIRLGLSPEALTITDPAILGAQNPDYNLSALVQVPSRLETISWTTANPSKHLLGKILISPTYVKEVENKGLITTYSPSMLAYCSRAFAYWRGSIIYRIQCVATQFHSGRLLFSFDPQSFFNTWDNMDVQQNHNVVIMDLQERQEITITCPYMSTRPWLRCDHLRTDKNMEMGFETAHHVNEDNIGVLYIFVQNPLVAPNNVAQNIDLNVYVQGGDNFELAVPVPLAPLNVTIDTAFTINRTRPYPFYKNGPAAERCKEEAMIYEWFKEGRVLFNRGEIAKDPDKSDKWYNFIPVKDMPHMFDVFCWCNRSNQIVNWKGVCRDVADKLGTYTPAAVTQSGEQYVTSRDQDGSEIEMTKGHMKAAAAPKTISENAMDLQTVLRRFYPLFSFPVVYNTVGYTVYAIPVFPTLQVSHDYPDATWASPEPSNTIQWFARLFTYWRGSLRYKFFYSGDLKDVICWHNPLTCLPFNQYSGVLFSDISEQLAYASVIAESNTQNCIEVEVPFYSPYEQLLLKFKDADSLLRSQNGTLFLAIRNHEGDPHTINAFISTGDDFVMNVLRAAPNVFEGWPRLYNDDGMTLREAEAHSSVADFSVNVDLPSVQRFDEYTGYWNYNPKVMDTRAQDFRNLPRSGVQMFGITETMSQARQTMQKMETSMSEHLDMMGFLVDNYQRVIGPRLVQTMSACDKTMQYFQRAVQRTDNMFVDAKNQTNSMIVDAANIGLQISAMTKGGVFIYSFYKWYTEGWTFWGAIQVYLAFSAFLGVSENLVSQFITKYFVTTDAPHFDFSAFTKAQHDFNSHGEEGAPPQAPSGGIAQGGSIFTEENLRVGIAALATLLYSAIFGKLPALAKVKKLITSFFSSEDEKEDPPRGIAQAGNDLADCLRNIHFSTMGISALDRVFKKALEIVNKIIDWWKEEENPKAQAQKHLEEKSDEVMQVLDEIASLEDEETFLLALKDPEVHARFWKLYDRATDLLEYCLKNDVNSKMFSIVRNIHTQVKTLCKKLENEKPSHGIRYDPFCVCLCGPTGTGKTEMMHRIRDVILECVDAPRYNSAYQLSTTEDKFWSGYTGQTVVEWDEMGQSVEQDPMIAQFMTLRSNAETRVNMAALEDKGRFFISKGIVMTTNVPYQNFNTVRDMAAFRRRRHLVIRMTHKDGWDVNRLQDSVEFDPEFKHAKFELCARDRDSVIRTFSGMQEMLAYVKSQCKQWDQKQKNIIQDYLLHHGSTRLPRGVRIEPVVYEDDTEQVTEFEVDTEDAEDPEEAELFRTMFEESTPQEQEEMHNEYRRVVLVLKKPSIARRLKQKFQDFCSTIWSSLKDFYEQYPRFCQVLGLLSLCGAAYSCYKLFWPTQKEMEKEQIKGVIENIPVALPSSVEPQTPFIKQYIKETKQASEGAVIYDPSVKKAPTPKYITKAQGSNDPQGEIITRARIHPHLSILTWENGRGILRGLWISGKMILVPYHFFAHAKPNEIFYVLRGPDAIPVYYCPERCCRYSNMDWCVYLLSAAHPSRRDISKYFVREADLERTAQCDAVLVNISVDGTVIEKQVRSTLYSEYSYDGVKGETYTADGYGYRADTQNGDCGSVLVHRGKFIQPPGKILGIHVAGNPTESWGFSILITYEQMNKVLQYFEAKFPPLPKGMPIPPEVKSEPEDIEQIKMFPQGAYSYYGALPPQMCPSQPVKSKIIPTPFQGELYPVTKAPAALKPKNNISPLAKALTKYGKVTTPFLPQEIKIVTQDMINEMRSCLKIQPMEKRLLTMEETVLGIPGSDYICPLNMQTSPGWPYQTLPEKKPGKHWLFDMEQGVPSHPLLKEKFEERLTEAKKGNRVASLWRDCLKDELRPLEKVEQCKTRLFIIAPTDFTLLVRMYFMSFAGAFYANNCTFWSAVGIDPESYDWTKMIKYLQAYGTKCIAGDFSSFDGTLMPDLMWASLEVVNAWYDDGPENALVRAVCMDEMIHTVQLVNNCVYATHQGNPSGNPLTVIINCMVNVMYMRLAWREIMLAIKPDLAPLYCFHDNVKMMCYGDDNILVVKEPVLDYFNQQTITCCLYNHGITYTLETKDQTQEIPKYRNLLEVSFLKRDIAVHPIYSDLYIPKMSVETITSFTNWVRENFNMEKQINENLIAALRFAYFHGQEFYESFYNKFSTAIRMAGMDPLYVSYHEFDLDFLARSGKVDERYINQQIVSHINRVMKNGYVEGSLYGTI